MHWKDTIDTTVPSPHRCTLVGWLVSWLFNSTSTQKGQFVPTAGRETDLVGRLRMANEIQCILSYVTQQQCNTVHSKTLQLHKRNNRLSNPMTYFLIIQFANIKPDPTHPIQYNFTLCGCSFMSWCTLTPDNRYNCAFTTPVHITWSTFMATRRETENVNYQ